MPAFPWTYIESCSTISLENFRLAELNAAAEHRKRIMAELDSFIEATANAEVARILQESSARVVRLIELRQMALDFDKSRKPLLPSSQEVQLFSRRARHG